MSKLVDAYTRANRIALQVFDDSGQNEFNGVDGRTLAAFARRGLVWFERHDHGLIKLYTGGLTEKGRAALAELEAESE